MVQERSNPNYTYSFPSEYFPGSINPLKKRVVRQFLNIDTRFRNNYECTSSTAFQFDLPLKLKSIVNMQLVSFEMPTAIYAFSKQLGNTTFVILLEGENQLVTIPDGNYNPNTLSSYLNQFVQSLGGLFASLVFSIDLTLDNSSGNGKMTVSIKPTTPPFVFLLNFQVNDVGQPDNITPLALKFGWKVGFRNGLYYDQYSYTSEGEVDLTGPRYLFLSIDDYNTSVYSQFQSAFTQSILNKNVLARISNVPTAFSVLAQNNLVLITSPREYYGPVDIFKLFIQLLDEYGRPVNLNFMDFSFCLSFQTLYDL